MPLKNKKESFVIVYVETAKPHKISCIGGNWFTLNRSFKMSNQVMPTKPKKKRLEVVLVGQSPTKRWSFGGDQSVVWPPQTGFRGGRTTPIGKGGLATSKLAIWEWPTTPKRYYMGSGVLCVEATALHRVYSLDDCTALQFQNLTYIWWLRTATCALIHGFIYLV